MRRHLRSLLMMGAALLALAAPAGAQTIFYARPGAVGGTGACATPFGLVADAIAAAKAAGGNTEIRLTGGVFTESGLVIDFSNVTIKGGYPTALTGCPNNATIEASRDILANPTTIDANSVDRHIRIIPQVDGTGNFLASNTGIVIDGILFTRGKPSGTESLSGGSIYITNCSARITNSTFRGNITAGFFANGTYANGGAIYQVGYPNPTTPAPVFRASAVTLDGNLFENNSTGNPAASVQGAGSGGAIYAADFNTGTRQTTLAMTNNVFRNNTANGSGDLTAATQCPDIYLDANGDGICEDNDGDGFCDPPDGIGDFNDACPLVDTNGNQLPPNRCHIFALGGAVAAVNVDGTWQGNTFEGNRSLANQRAQVNFSGNGGAIYVTSSFQASRDPRAPIITNNTFTSNTADAGGGTATGCGTYSAFGGAAYLVWFRSQLTNNTFDQNVATATLNGADNTAWGGGVLLLAQGEPLVDGNTITNNQAASGTGSSSAFGGGLCVDDFRQGATPIVTNNIIRGNDAPGTAQVSGYGGGLSISATGYSTLVAGNVIENNSASAPSGVLQAGWGGGMWGRLANGDILVADNIVRNNLGSPLDPGFPAQMAGIATGPALVLDSPDAAARFQNNLIVGNDGVGLSLFGFTINGVGDLLNGSELYHNTIADNGQSGILFSLANTLVMESNILWGNDTLNQGWPEMIDDWLGQDVATDQIVARQNFVTNIPSSDPTTGWPAMNTVMTNPANRNQVGVDPQFATDPGPGGLGYYLRQAPDTAAPFSAAVDFGSMPAGQRDFGNNPNYVGQSMALRTTKPVAKTADLCFVDVGFHHQLGAPAPDSDGDAIPDADELVLGTLPNDADTDNDGVLDGLDCGSDIDGDGTIAALDCDTDGDGLTDGLELGLTIADLNADTDTADTCDTSNAPCGRTGQPTWTEDTQPTSTTNPLLYDTDGGGESDGCEDLDRDGFPDRPTPSQTDRDESNPNSANDDDPDVDGLPNNIEAIAGTNTDDRDTDDDGVADGDELNAPPWYDIANPPADFPDPSVFYTDAVNCDTDQDGILDGVERSQGPVTVPPDAEPGTKGTDCPRDPVFCVTTTCFQPDADPRTAAGGSATAAYCLNPLACEGFDTDGDGCGDGIEDANQNGRIDGGESDPNDPTSTPAGCSAGGIVYYEAITSLYAAAPAPPANTCGPLTVPRMHAVLTTSCTLAPTGCEPNDAIAPGTETGSLASGDTYTLTAWGQFPLVFFESGDCGSVPYVCKNAAGTVTVQDTPCN